MKWKKIGQIFDPTKWDDGIERNWMKEFSQSTSTLIFDDFVRVYFSCRPHKDKNNQATSYTTFMDLDRNDLTKILRVHDKPILPLGELGSFDEFAIYPTSVIRKENNEVWLYYAGWNRMQSVPFNTSIGLAISKDEGVSFDRIGSGPILSHNLDEPFVISGPKIRKFNGVYYLFYLAGSKWIKENERSEIIYKNRMAKSTDGINWDRLGVNIVADKLNENECQAGPDVFHYKGKYHMYYVYRYGTSDHRDIPGRGYKIGYAHSNDLIDWVRDDDNAGITYSESGWDSTMHHYPHIFDMDGKHYMLYNGNEFGKYGFGLAVLEDE